MLQSLINKLGTVVYVQIWEKRIKVTDIKTGNVFDDEPFVAVESNKKNGNVILAIGKQASSKLGHNVKVINPFSHPRALLSDFIIGEKLLQHAFRSLFNKALIKPAPAVVIHPMEKIEGGLTMVEERAFKEMAIGAGARDAIVYDGGQLSISGFDYEGIKARLEN